MVRVARGWAGVVEFHGGDELQRGEDALVKHKESEWSG